MAYYFRANLEIIYNNMKKIYKIQIMSKSNKNGLGILIIYSEFLKLIKL